MSEIDLDALVEKQAREAEESIDKFLDTLDSYLVAMTSPNADRAGLRIDLRAALKDILFKPVIHNVATVMTRKLPDKK